jgi:iron complex outermembrane recepter protein
MRYCVLIPGLLLGNGVLAAAPEEVVDEVIVTATFRQQALQDVPASVSVLDSAVLNEADRQHFEDVLALVPNLNWAGGTSRPRYFQIRGIGEREQYEGAPNPSVGFLIDDIDFSGIGMPATLFDVERIEVLRGPQGTRYGANALAGLVMIKGNEPKQTPGYYVEAGAGDYGMRNAGVAATGPIEALSSTWRLSLQQQSSDGFMRNAYLSRDDTNDRNELTGRFKWRWQPSEATSVDFTVLHADLDNGYDAWTLDNTRVSLSDRPGEDSQRATGASLRITTTAIADYTLTTIASFGDSESTNSFDADWGNAESWGDYTYDYFSRSDRERSTSSFETRLASAAANEAGELGWLLGVYAMRMAEDGRDVLSGVYADPSDPSWDGTSSDELLSAYDATNLAVFGQLDHNLTERWRWSAGLRLEQRNADYEDQGIWSAAPQTANLDSRDRMVGGQISLSVDVTEELTAYLSGSRGYKAGGFNLGNIPAEAREFSPEYLWSVESGVKGYFSDGRGYFDAALFYQWRKDLQVRSGQQLDPQNPGTYTFVTDNLPNGYNTGVETTVSYSVTPSLRIGGALGLLRTRAKGGIAESGVAVSSREQAHAPEYTVGVYADWRHANGFGARIDASAKDNFFFDVPTDHDMRSRSYVLTNIKIGYERDRWSTAFYVKNLFDEDYAVRGFYFYNEPPFTEKSLYTQLGEPRQVGMSVSWRTP